MLTIGSIVWGALDIPRAVEFWTAALDYRLRDEPSEDWATLIPNSGEGAQLALMLVDSEKAHRHHLDLYSDDQSAEVARLVDLGATVVDSWDYEDDADYVVLTDTEGNPFCVVQK